MERLNTINEDPRFQSYMSAEEDDRKILNSIKHEYYDKGIEDGLEQGIEQGIQQGIQQGIEQGIEQGIKNAVISFYDNCKDIELISKSLNIEADKVREYINTREQ